MKKVYVAGKYSADNVLDVLRNIGRGQAMCSKLFSLGFAPFCPWHDKSYIIDNPDTDFTKQQFQDASMVWLEASDAVFVLPDSKKSNGVAREIYKALELKIPVFFSLYDLIKYMQK